MFNVYMGIGFKFHSNITPYNFIKILQDHGVKQEWKNEHEMKGGGQKRKKQKRKNNFHVVNVLALEECMAPQTFILAQLIISMMANFQTDVENRDLESLTSGSFNYTLI